MKRRQVRRDTVSAGETFSFSENPPELYAKGCMALASGFLSRALKKRYWGGGGVLFHATLFSGGVSWSRPDTLVWIES
jgi:hypothetical protein